MALFLLTGCPPKRWTPCECDDTEYLLFIDTLGGGSTSQNPNRTLFKKGEYVTVNFTPNENRYLDIWYCSPPSHLALLSRDTSVGVYITDETILMPLTGAKTKIVHIYWNSSRGTVQLPQGAQPGNPYSNFTMYVNYGDTISLVATPDSGYYTIWQHIPSGQQFSNSITLKVMDNITLEPVFIQGSKPPLTNSITVNTTGGAADVFTAGSSSESYGAGYYLQSTTSAPDGYYFSFRVDPHKGFAHKYTTWNAGGQTAYTTQNFSINYYGGEYTSHLVDKIRLDISTEGQGVVTSPHFVYDWNPQPYIAQGIPPKGHPPATSLSQNTTANQVTMTAEPCPGWSFRHWEYKDAHGQTQQPTYPSLTVYMNWWTGAGIHVPDGQNTFNLKAVFVEKGIDISLYSTQEGCFAGYAQRTTGTNCYAFTTGRDVIEALINATNTHCTIGNVYIFSHAWVYNSTSGQVHSGGFYGNGPDDSGFYGQRTIGDHEDARDLTDLQNAISAGTIKFAKNTNLRIFLEGCRIGETGSSISIPSSFVTSLANITKRNIVSCCGGSSEYSLTQNSVTFLSAAGSHIELNDGRYDGWIEKSLQKGAYCTVPTFVFAN